MSTTTFSSQITHHIIPVIKQRPFWRSRKTVYRALSTSLSSYPERISEKEHFPKTEQLRSNNTFQPSDRGEIAGHCTGLRVGNRQREGDLFVRTRGRVFEEPLSQYKRGGYHPLGIGDTLLEGRYTIINKLAWGKDAITWLAKDSRYSRHVAIKIFRSEIREQSENEATLLRILSTGTPDHPGKKYVGQLIDRFDIVGPNGLHLCLLFEPLGPPMNFALGPLAAWKVAKQMAEAIYYTHDMGIAHGDLSKERFLFTNPRFLHRENDLKKPFIKGTAQAIQPVDTNGNVLPVYASTKSSHVPQYLTDSPEQIEIGHLQQMGNENPKEDDYKVQLHGFGNKRVFKEEPWFVEDNCLGYQAPEVLLDSKIQPSADIWSLACLMFEVLSGHQPFRSMENSKYDSPLMSQWLERFGDLPQEWATRVPQDVTSISVQPGQRSLHDQLKEIGYSRARTKSWYSKGDVEALGDLLTSMAQYRPADRPTAAEVLRHPWFMQEPSLCSVDGPSTEREISAHALDAANYRERRNTKLADHPPPIELEAEVKYGSK